jgi:hypothetical protein
MIPYCIRTPEYNYRTVFSSTGHTNLIKHCDITAKKRTAYAQRWNSIETIPQMEMQDES